MDIVEMATAYNNYSYTHNYIVGGVCGNVVKFGFCTFNDLCENFTTITSSQKNGAVNTLRLLFSKELKARVNKDGVELCTKEEFELLAKEVGGNGRSNRGLAFEKLVTEFFGQHWKADNVPFTEAGDIEIDGVAYQIKSHKAVFASELKLQELMRAGE